MPLQKNRSTKKLLAQFNYKSSMSGECVLTVLCFPCHCYQHGHKPLPVIHEWPQNHHCHAWPQAGLVMRMLVRAAQWWWRRWYLSRAPGHIQHQPWWPSKVSKSVKGLVKDIIFWQCTRTNRTSTQSCVVFCGLRWLNVFTCPLAANPGLYTSAAAPLGQMAPAAVREERRQPAAFSASPARQQAPPPEEGEDTNDYDSDEASECTITPAWVHFNQENNDKESATHGGN